MRPLPQTRFPGDDGAAEASVRAALAEAERDPAPQTYLAAVAELCLTRLLVPVVASGATASEHSALSVAMVRSADRIAMLAFTGLDALHRWDPAGRPVLVTVDAAAGSAVADGADTLLVDLAGPHPLELTGEVLTGLASGHRLLRLPDGGFGWAISEPSPEQSAERSEQPGDEGDNRADRV